MLVVRRGLARDGAGNYCICDRLYDDSSYSNLTDSLYNLYILYHTDSSTVLYISIASTVSRYLHNLFSDCIFDST